MMSSGETDDAESIDGGVIVLVVFLIGGILGAVSNPQDAVFAFFSIGSIFAVVGWLFGTTSGRELLEEMNENQQQQQQVGGSSSEQKEPCPNCGWQNPSRNNYCYDCGSQLVSEQKSVETDITIGKKSDEDKEVEKIQEKYTQGEIDEETFEEEIEESLEQSNE